MAYFASIPLLDSLAFCWFLICWFGYSMFSGFKHHGYNRLQDSLYEHIKCWIKVMQQRDNRIIDTSVITGIERNASFFASSCLLIIAGLITALGSVDKALSLVANVPLAHADDRQLMQMILFLLIIIFAYAFFTFTWSIRQWGFAAILVGSMPLSEHYQAQSAQADKQGDSLAHIIWLAVYHFNMGLRAYYFSMAILTWVIHPYLFMATTTWIVLVLYRREFRSRTLSALQRGLAASVEIGSDK